MKKVAIFDLDGTLTDSKRNVAASVNFARAKRGLAALEENDITEKINALTFASAKDFYGENATQADHDVFEAHYAKACLNDLRLYDGIAETLAALNDRGVKMAVATNATSVFARKMLDFARVSRYFTIMLGADNVVDPKPAPDMLFLALEALGASANEAIFLGDSGKDMKAARAAGVTGVFAAWGYGTENALADRVIAKPIELLEIF
jgi:phosphoglycolate phosphatase